MVDKYNESGANNSRPHTESYINVKEIIILDHHKVVYSGDFREFCNSENIQAIRDEVLKRGIDEKVFHKDKLIVFLSNESIEDIEPIAHLILGGNRDA